MLSLKEKFAGRHGFDNFPLPANPFQLEKAIQEARRQMGNVTPKLPSAFDLVETYNALRATVNNLQAIKQLPMRHIRRAPWVLFQSPTEEGETLADNKRFLVAYLSELRERASASATLAFATVYLRFYPVGSPHAELLQVALVNQLKMLKTPRGAAFREKSTEFHLFRKDGPDRVSRLMLETGDPLSVALQAGLIGPLEEQGFIEAASRQLIGRISKQLSRGQLPEEVLGRLLGYFEAATGDKGQLRFPRLRVSLAGALLLPYLKRDPDPDIKTLLSDFLLSHYNDPRLSRADWHGVSEGAMSVIMRWLVSATLEDFFRVVSEGSMGHRDADRMWPYRRAFWSAYLEGGYISDAWVVLGEVIAYDARSFLKDQAGSYGRLEKGYQVQPRHAVLIMRIGDLVITEWSFSGKYRAWSTGNEMAPKFYKKSYNRNQLVKSPDFEGVHHGAPHGTWQNQLSDLISEWTGIKVHARQYMPR